MRILLDTNVFLWILTDDVRLSASARRLYLDDSNQLFLSMASLWEMFIKIGTGKLEIADRDPVGYLRAQLVENAITFLPITYEQVSGLLGLPKLHKDPFDRLIIAQALHEGLPMLSSDEIFADYGVRNLF
ncbi:MAG: type II toxin-antitoxin system VapC family toxin [Spirochaetota bacterium]